ncbi:MAG: MFS transporter [Spirochaetae bacterium HGW-Spirochaetae-9]|nr:MAG: MFS transporter [Spirochaetae bacterium HGW-Spirochaetae-9]
MLTNDRVRYSEIGVLTVSHMLNDLYSNYLPQMLPFLMVSLQGFSITKAAILTASFTITSSIVQPVFGYFVDNTGRRWLVHVGTLWMALMLSLTGIVGSYWMLVVLSSLAGLGTAAFHPQAASMMNLLSGKHKAVLFSLFSAFGNIGFALGPLLLVPLFQAFGLKATLVTVIPGILVTVLLFFFAPRIQLSTKAGPSLQTVLASVKAASRQLVPIVAIIAVRSLAYTGMLTLLPLYFAEKQLSAIAASHLVTIMLFSGAIGGIIGGFISDRYGRKPLIVVSLMMSTPFFFAFLATQGPLSIVFLALAGACLLASFSVTVVAAQEAIPDNKALAAGISMGLAGGLGGLAVIFIGRLGDVWGLPQAVFLLFSLPVVAGLIALSMQRQKR